MNRAILHPAQVADGRQGEEGQCSLESLQSPHIMFDAGRHEWTVLKDGGLFQRETVLSLEPQSQEPTPPGILPLATVICTLPPSGRHAVWCPWC